MLWLIEFYMLNNMEPLRIGLDPVDAVLFLKETKINCLYLRSFCLSAGSQASHVHNHSWSGSG